MPGILYKAPWPNATPEEELAYSQSVEFGNMEQEADIAATMGEFGADAIDMTAVRSVLYPNRDNEMNLYGLYQPMEVRKEYANLSQELKDEVVLDKAERYFDVYAGAELNPVDEMRKAMDDPRQNAITAYGSGNNPGTQSHEFRHAVIDKFRNMPDPPKEDKSDKANALREIKELLPWRGEDEEAWNRRFNVYRGADDRLENTLQSKAIDRRSAYPKGTTLAEAMVEEFNRWEFTQRLLIPKFAKIEAYQQILDGVPAPKGILNSWAKHFEEQGFARHEATTTSWKKRMNKAAGKELFKIDE